MWAFIKNKIFKKIKSSRGETITETLVSLIIIVLAMAMLATSIVAAASVNNKVKKANTAFKAENNTETSADEVIIVHGANDSTSSTESESVTVYITEDDNAYVYYDQESTEETAAP